MPELPTSIQIVGLDFKEAEDDQEMTFLESLRQGRGINLRLRADFATYSNFSRLIEEQKANLFGEEPDSLIIEHEVDSRETKITPLTGHPDEGGVPVPEQEKIFGKGMITFKKELPVIIAPNPNSLDGLCIKIGAMWLPLLTGGESDPAEAAEWQEFCRALTERNTKNEDRRHERGLPVSYAPRVIASHLLTDTVFSGPVTNANTHVPRKGPKIQARPAYSLRLPTSEYVKDAMMGLSRGEFTPTEGLDGVFTLIGDTQLRIECDDASGLDTVRAVEMLAAYGPATMQTFLGLMGLWLEHNPGASHETYFTVRASDLMRYMHRRETAGGGYNTDDQMQKGREVFLLSRATVPRATTKVHRAGKLTVQTLSVDRLIHVQTLAAQRTLEEGKEIQSILEFRYHPNKEMHEMLCGDTPQFAEVSGKLLAYHPAREKYQIVLGFGLAFYDRVNRKYARKERKIGLLSLLTLAGISAPNRNFPSFLVMMQKAIATLSADGVVPGAALSFPDRRTHSGRQMLAKAVVTFPPLSPALSSGESPELTQKNPPLDVQKPPTRRAFLRWEMPLMT